MNKENIRLYNEMRQVFIYNAKPETVETQKQLVAIWNGKYDQHFRNYWRQ